MTITKHGTANSTQSNAAGTTIDTGTVASCLQDDFCIVGVAMRSTGGADAGSCTPALQSGSTGTIGSFTQLATGGFGAGSDMPAMQWWFARCTGAGSIGVTVTLPNSRARNAGLLVLRGVPNTATPVTAVNNNGTGTTAGAGPIAPIQAGDWAVGCTSFQGAQDVTPTASPAFTEDVEARHATDSDLTDRVTLHLEHYEVPDTSNVSSGPAIGTSLKWRSSLTVIPSVVAASSVFMRRTRSALGTRSGSRGIGRP